MGEFVHPPKVQLDAQGAPVATEGGAAADAGAAARGQAGALRAAAPAPRSEAAPEADGHAHAEEAADAPEPTAPAAGAAAPLSDADRWKKIEELLNKSALGKAALNSQKTHGVKVNYVAGTGSFYAASSNTMTIDTSKPVERNALSFVHEMNHAVYAKTGKTAKIGKLGREEYVKKMLAEEVEGVILSIECKGEIVNAGTPIAAKYPLESAYWKAYGDKKDKAAARARVLEGFEKGEVKTSNTNETYPAYYGKAWDAEHAP